MLEPGVGSAGISSAARAERQASSIAPVARPSESSFAKVDTARVAPEREKDIDEWVSQNANAEDSFAGVSYDKAGGERVSKALNGDSSLGSLSLDEQRHLIDTAVVEWQQHGDTESIREAAENLDSEDTRRVVAEAYAAPSAADQRHFASGGTSFTTAELENAKHEMFKIALDLDPTAVIKTFEGVEGELGRKAGVLDRSVREDLLKAVGSNGVDPADDGISKMVTAIFLKSESSDFLNSEYRQQMSGSLARIMVGREGRSGLQIESDISTLTNRYDAILSSSGGRDLLASDKVLPDLRGWAISEIATNPDWTADTLKDGWDSKIVSSTYGSSVVEKYQARGVASQVLGGEALRNTIGQAINIQPDRLPDGSESTAEAAARVEAGLNHQYYGANPRIDAIAEQIKAIGGDNAEVSIMPVTVTGEDFGAATFNVFKVKDEAGKTWFIEDVDPSRRYEGFADWQANNRLPPGQMTYVAGMDWGSAGGKPSLITEATPLVRDTFGEWARHVGDYAATGVAIAAGVALVVGTGGMAAVVGAGAAGLYTTARAGEELYDAHAHGVDLSDLSNDEVRAHWLDVAAGTLSFGAIGAAKWAVSAGANGTSAVAARSVAGLQLAANTADAAAATNQAHDLASNWKNLSNADRAMGMLNVAFWGGMGVASTRAGGGTMSDALSFTRLQNNLQYGAPFPVQSNPQLQSGEMRVTYDTRADGRATDITIEYGGMRPDPQKLELHARTARQIDAAGGLIDQIKTQFTGGKSPEIGSAAWEARLELKKIEAEAKSIGQDLQQPNLTTEERARLTLRLEELETATLNESDRLTQLDELGEGWVAAPTKGTAQAEALGWPEAESGYIWVAGKESPYIRRIDANGGDDRLYYDPVVGNFSPAKSLPPMERIGHGTSDVKWTTNAEGQTIEVTATLRELFLYPRRSSAELSAQSKIEGKAPGDQAGHIIGQRFKLDSGLQNLFPQDAQLNVGAYKTMENELADWIEAGGEVKLNVKLHDLENGRPSQIEVAYEVVEPKTEKVIHRADALFQNGPDQRFDRLSKQQILETFSSVSNQQ